ncbi:MAG TPA: SDR family NAD(P)-dependent oxidoreductase [Candidatus Eisenbacteria bacterium]|nr:SDR family NAD(P)-dependent oxidoreductase [Candidatus Eisenbacteria bacterium]
MDNEATAIITGGTGALGSVVTRSFLRAGYRSAVTYRASKEWEALAASEKAAVAEGRLLGFAADVTDDASLEGAVASAASEFGRLDVLVHVAGGYAGGRTVENLDAKSVRGMIDLNLVSAFWAAKHVVPHAKKHGRGRLLFISSRGAVECQPGAAPYAAAKLGLHALVQTLARELKRDGVTAHAVLPSVIDTAANRAAMPDGEFGDWVKPEAIAEVLVFLASENAAATSGALVPIYGRA